MRRRVAGACSSWRALRGSARRAWSAQPTREPARTACMDCARAGELERDFSYGVVRQLFESPVAGAEGAGLLTGAAALAGPVLDIARVGESGAADPSHGTLHGLYWLTANVAERGPVLISVDDLHWCDQPSLRYLVYLVRRLEGLRVLLLATTRPESDPDPGLIDQLANDPATTTIRLRALSLGGVATLLASRLGSSRSRSSAPPCMSVRRATPARPRACRGGCCTRDRADGAWCTRGPRAHTRRRGASDATADRAAGDSIPRSRGGARSSRRRRRAQSSRRARRR